MTVAKPKPWHVRNGFLTENRMLNGPRSSARPVLHCCALAVPVCRSEVYILCTAVTLRDVGLKF